MDRISINTIDSILSNNYEFRRDIKRCFQSSNLGNFFLRNMNSHVFKIHYRCMDVCSQNERVQIVNTLFTKCPLAIIPDNQSMYKTNQLDKKQISLVIPDHVVKFDTARILSICAVKKHLFRNQLIQYRQLPSYRDTIYIHRDRVPEFLGILDLQREWIEFKIGEGASSDGGRFRF